MNEKNLKVFVCDNCGGATLAANRGADCDCGGTYSLDPATRVIINLTPDVVRLNDGTEYPPSGTVARVTSEYRELSSNPTCYEVVYGEVTGLPPHQDGVDFIVSAMVAAACPERGCLLVPATGHPEAVRVNGQVYSVPGFQVNGWAMLQEAVWEVA